MAKKKYTPTDIGKIAFIKRGTKIRMLEYDLHKSPIFFWMGNRWERLFQTWLEQGAKIEVYAQAPSKDSVRMLKYFKGKNPFSFSAYSFKDVSDKVLGIKKDELKYNHFTLFRTPKKKGLDEKQLWVERKHLPEDKNMYECKFYQPEGFTLGVIEKPWEKEFKKYERILDRILAHKGIKVKRKIKGGSLIINS